MPVFRLSRAGLVLTTLAVLGVTSAHGACPHTLTVVDRAIAQERVPQDKVTQDPKWFWQTWQVDYRLRLDGPTGLVVTPAEVSLLVEGWVSNSRVPTHAAPRWSTITLSGTSGLVASTELIPAADEAERCRERGVLQVWVGGEDPDNQPAAVATSEVGKPSVDEPGSPGERGPLFSLAPGDTVRVRLRLVHQHFLYGMYDPLLGRRSIELRLGSVTLRDTVPLDREHHVAQAPSAWTNLLDDRRDSRQFVSPPDSLHLEAHVPGNQFYRFPEQPVRYSTKMRLRYWYLVAPGTEGECKARLAQYKDTPTAWKVLSDGGHEECLSVVGRWVHVERIFRTEPEATTLALDFRIVGADVGELWIDDVSLEPVGAGPAGP